jgi:hypothetical protein
MGCNPYGLCWAKLAVDQSLEGENLQCWGNELRGYEGFRESILSGLRSVVAERNTSVGEGK